MTKTHSRIIFSLNSKGGSGNTAAMVALADFLIHNLGLNPKLVDCDLANKTFGSLSHIFKGTPKLDVRTETGLDDLLAIAKPAEPTRRANRNRTRRSLSDRKAGRA